VKSINPDINNSATLNLITELWPALNTASLNSNIRLIRNIGQYGKTRISWVETATPADLDEYDPAVDAGWPSN